MTQPSKPGLQKYSTVLTEAEEWKRWRRQVWYQSGVAAGILGLAWLWWWVFIR